MMNKKIIIRGEYVMPVLGMIQHIILQDFKQYVNKFEGSVNWDLVDEAVNWLNHREDDKGQTKHILEYYNFADMLKVKGYTVEYKNWADDLA